MTKFINRLIYFQQIREKTDLKTIFIFILKNVSHMKKIFYNISHVKNKLDVFQVSQFKVPFEKPKDWVTPNGDIIQHRPFKKYLRSDLGSIFASQGINDPFLKERELVAMVFPFKINQFTIDQINWSSYLDDPIFKLTFPQPSMLSAKEINDLSDLIESGESRHYCRKFLIFDLIKSRTR